MTKMKKGFTLVEMLVVLGIIAVLVGATVGAYSKMTGTAEKTKCQELVNNTATALTALFQQHGVWPKALIRNNNQEAGLDATAAYPLKDYMSLTLSSDGSKLAGLDKFGIVSPWATAHIKRRGSSASISDKVASGTIQTHTLKYALDLDGDGIIEGVQVGGETVDIRATAAVWCCGKDGVLENYAQGLRKDDVYSWTKGQTQNVK